MNRREPRLVHQEDQVLVAVSYGISLDCDLLRAPRTARDLAVDDFDAPTETEILAEVLGLVDTRRSPLRSRCGSRDCPASQ